MTAGLAWPAAVLNLDQNEVSPCSLPRTSWRLPMTERCAEGQMRHIDFVARHGEAPGFFCSYR